EWLVPVESESTPITPCSVEKEPPPPIPSELVGRECLYGFIITEDIYRRREITHSAFYNVARPTRPRGHDDIAWFSYTKGGIVRVKQVPIASSIERFAMELGIEEKPQWHDAWVNYQVQASTQVDTAAADIQTPLSLRRVGGTCIQVPANTRGNAHLYGNMDNLWISYIGLGFFGDSCALAG
ncbi:hypothetical protein C8F01DRAFT_1153167, partial [Mycena amicta]